MAVVAWVTAGSVALLVAAGLTLEAMLPAEWQPAFSLIPDFAAVIAFPLIGGPFVGAIIDAFIGAVILLIILRLIKR